MNKQYNKKSSEEQPTVFLRPVEDYSKCCQDCKATFSGAGEKEERIECIKGCKDVAKGGPAS